MSHLNPYENDGFDSESIGRASNSADEKRHLLKLSIDFLSVKDMKVSANLTVCYSLRLLSASHHFKSSQATAVNTSPQEVKLQNSFASYEFQANKQELQGVFTDNYLIAKLIHAGTTEFGTATVDLRELLSAPLKKTPQATVRVSDQYLPIKENGGATKGLIRCILYLQDMGEVAATHAATTHHGVTRQKSQGTFGGQSQLLPQTLDQNQSPNQPAMDQVVWQLELWKRSEESKFKAWLKQRELDRIEEVTSQWRNKEQERERLFLESMNRVAQLETKVRGKAVECQRREERIVQLEEELKHKIAEVGRQLTVKEEEVLNVKKRFKEERQALEGDKKRLQQQLDEAKQRAEQAEARLLSLKRDVDESPLSVLRSELAQKNLLIAESDTKIKAISEERDDARKKFDTLKKDMISLKKQLDREQKDTLARQSEELEKLKNDIRNKQAQDEERRELNALKQQLTNITTKLAESQKPPAIQTGKAAPETLNDRVGQQSTINPFLSQGFVPAASTQLVPNNGGIIGSQPLLFVDNYARCQPSPQKQQQSYFGGSMTEVDRLMAERNDLMNSGCYTQDDPLIQELDRQIRATQLRQRAQ